MTPGNENGRPGNQSGRRDGNSIVAQIHSWVYATPSQLRDGIQIWPHRQNVVLKVRPYAMLTPDIDHIRDLRPDLQFKITCEDPGTAQLWRNALDNGNFATIHGVFA